MAVLGIANEQYPFSALEFCSGTQQLASVSLGPKTSCRAPHHSTTAKIAAIKPRTAVYGWQILWQSRALDKLR